MFKKLAIAFSTLAAMSAPNISLAQTDELPNPRGAIAAPGTIFDVELIERLANKSVVFFDIPAPDLDAYINKDEQGYTQAKQSLIASLKSSHPNEMQKLEARLYEFGSNLDVFTETLFKQAAENMLSSTNALQLPAGNVTLGTCFIDNKSTLPTKDTFDERSDVGQIRFITIQLMRLMECRNDADIITVGDALSYRPENAIRTVAFARLFGAYDNELVGMFLDYNLAFEIKDSAGMFAAMMVHAPAFGNTKHTKELFNYMGGEYTTILSEFIAAVDSGELKNVNDLLDNTSQQNSVRGAAAFVIKRSSDVILDSSLALDPYTFDDFDRYINKAELDCAANGGRMTGKNGTKCVLAPQ